MAGERRHRGTAAATLPDSWGDRIFDYLSGPSRLQFSIKRLIFDVLYSWFWVALLLFFLGFATGYIAEFSSQALTTWLWVAPMSQIGAHLALRAAAPYL